MSSALSATTTMRTDGREHCDDHRRDDVFRSCPHPAHVFQYAFGQAVFRLRQQLIQCICRERMKKKHNNQTGVAVQQCNTTCPFTQS
jgi:hypothetical protein